MREATHLISFGLKPGDEKASALADELTSEIINKGLVALQTKEYSYSQEQLTDSNVCLEFSNILRLNTIKGNK